MTLLQDYHEENNWWFEGGGRLILEDSDIVSPYTHMMTFTGSSSASIDHGQLLDAFLTLGDDTTITVEGSSIQHVSPDLVNVGSTPGATCTVEIADSFVHEMSFGLTGQAHGTVSGMRPGVLSDWALDGVSDSQMSVHLTNIELENVNWLLGGSASVTFEGCVSWQLGVIDNGQTVVRNSRVGQASMVFAAGQHAVLRGLISGELVAFWGLHDSDPSSNAPFDYTVINSSVDGWYLRIRGADLTLENCDLHGSRLRPEFDSSSSLTRVVGTYVEELMLWWSCGMLQFENSTVHHIVTPVSSSTTISGSLCVEQKTLKTDWGPWNESNITREYPIYVTSQYGLPLSRVPVNLIDPDDVLIVAGETDESGYFSFSIPFSDSTYLEEWTLQVGTGAGTSEIPVSLLSDTPLDAEWLESAALRVTSPEGNVVAGSVHCQSFVSEAADVAEWVAVSELVEPGDVLELDPLALKSYKRAASACSSLAAGVVSTEPGITLGGSGEEGRALLALIGIVLVKVTNEGGSIMPGDLLVTSSTPGHAMRWSGADACLCALVGKALEPMTEDCGVIRVLLTAH